MTPLVIYIAGPYSAATNTERIANTVRAAEAGLDVIRRGHWPFIPHLTHYFDAWHKTTYGHWLDPETYMRWDFAILRRCDGLLFLGSSPGADRELDLARELGMPVWMDVGDVPAVGR